MDLNLASVASALQGDEQLCDDELYLQLGECKLRLRSNSAEFITKLRLYFMHVAGDAGPPDLDLIAIEREAPDLGLEFIDWEREPGKTGRKDAYIDIPDGRLILKVRTGMLFLQSENYRIAAGSCIEYDNQIINFVNAQYMNWLQHRNWMICHASGLVFRDRCLGMAGFSGGGKSTLMLHLMEHDEVSYLTNDRLFVIQEAGEAQAVGIPKLPRINPGTIVHNPRLEALIPAQEREALKALPPHDLWEIEDKYDVQVEQFYGAGKITPSAPLGAFLVLNWQRGSDEPVKVQKVDLSQRRDLLGAIMKSPGPFYQYPDGSFHQDTTPFDEQAYLDALQGVTVYEASGGVDFDGLVNYCLEELMLPEAEPTEKPQQQTETESTRELLILRHGKSDWDNDLDDFNRPLQDRGKRDAQRIGVWLQQQDLLPDYVVSSPAERAIVTAEKCCKVMGMASSDIHQDKRIYAADLSDLMAVLNSCPEEARRVMLVGHNPGLEELLGYLVDQEGPLSNDDKLLPTATLARLKVNGDWGRLGENGAVLESITKPASLPREFPFPSTEGDEFRIRPAYYYSQSSVIPYRIRKGKPEILIISSSKRKHWVVPKGIKEPGLTPQESAAKEAWEEAGAEGEVANNPLGSYRCEKWGGTCTVAVYPMEVIRLIPKKQWEERHRGRTWVSPKKAAKLLKQKELKPLVKMLTKMLKKR